MSDHISRERVIRAGRRAGILEVVQEDFGTPYQILMNDGTIMTWCVFCGADWTMELSLANNTYKCLSCREEGDSLDYIRERDGVTLEEAVVKLEKMEL